MTVHSTFVPCLIRCRICPNAGSRSAISRPFTATTPPENRISPPIPHDISGESCAHGNDIFKEKPAFIDYNFALNRRTPDDVFPKNDLCRMTFLTHPAASRTTESVILYASQITNRGFSYTSQITKSSILESHDTTIFHFFHSAEIQISVFQKLPGLLFYLFPLHNG